MNNTNNPDEALSIAELSALESKLSIITDVSRSDSDAALLSESEFIQAQTFDKLINLANQGITLQPVVFTKPSVEAPASSRKSNFRKGLIALSAALIVMFSVVLAYQAISTRTVTPSSDSIPVASSENGSSFNYWNDSIDNQISEFEGEMICLSTNYDNLNFVVEGMYYLDDFSESGDF